jgi:hypothetical protein
MRQGSHKNQMVYGFELEIHRLLKDSDNPVSVADEILKRWDTGQLSWRDQEVAGEFLITAGFTNALFQQIAKALKGRQKIPWVSFVEALGKVNAHLTKDEVDQLLVGAAEEDALEAISKSRALDGIDPRFSKIRKNANNELKLKKAMMPEPPQNQNVTAISDHTRPLVQKLKVKKTSLADWARRTEENATPETLAQIEKMAADMLEQSRLNPDAASDIAISLRFMGLSEKALSALKHAPPVRGTLWLELDLLLETGRFVQALQRADMLERRFTGDPEATFSAGYARAISLYGLGQKDEARILLEGIVKVRPNYRSAHSLLMKWKSEER